MAKDILLLGEVVDGRLASITRELLGIGGILADKLSEKVQLVLPGNNRELGLEAIALGADRVFFLNPPLPYEYSGEAYTPALERVCRQLEPSIFLLGQTEAGRDLAPHLAARLKTGLVPDCLELDIDPQTRLLLQTRPVYGGNAHAQFACRTSRPQMATVRPKAMAPAELSKGRQGEIQTLEVAAGTTGARIRVLQRVKEEAPGIKLEDAPVVVSGGRGIGGKEGFEMLHQLAGLLKGAVGSTRAACDEGWIPTSAQVGQTGKTVSPTLYIAIALSGSSQHLAGCSGSKNIVAINKDAEANIFKASRFGVVADYRQVVPALIAKLKETLQK